MREHAGWDGAVALAATLLDVPQQDRKDAVAVFFDACVKSDFLAGHGESEAPHIDGYAPPEATR